MFKETVINQCSGGFGQWQAGEYNGSEWEFEEDLISAMYQSVPMFELGVDELPEGLEDIRGNIINEPDRVFGYFDTFGEDKVYYIGVSEITD